MKLYSIKSGCHAAKGGVAIQLVKLIHYIYIAYLFIFSIK